MSSLKVAKLFPRMWGINFITYKLITLAICTTEVTESGHIHEDLATRFNSQTT